MVEIFHGRPLRGLHCIQLVLQEKLTRFQVQTIQKQVNTDYAYFCMR